MKHRKPLLSVTALHRFFFALFFLVQVRLTLELITVCDFTLPVTSLFIDVKRQSTGASDLFKTRLSTPGS